MLFSNGRKVKQNHLSFIFNYSDNFPDLQGSGRLRSEFDGILTFCRKKFALVSNLVKRFARHIPVPVGTIHYFGGSSRTDVSDVEKFFSQLVQLLGTEGTATRSVTIL
jgi:hypothetical protein